MQCSAVAVRHCEGVGVVSILADIGIVIGGIAVLFGIVFALGCFFFMGES